MTMLSKDEILISFSFKSLKSHKSTFLKIVVHFDRSHIGRYPEGVVEHSSGVAHHDGWSRNVGKQCVLTGQKVEKKWVRLWVVAIPF